MKRFEKHSRQLQILLAVILLLGVFLRFYNIPARYGFDYDASRDALIALEGARSFQLPLMGPPSAQGPFNFGPWYYYQLILFSTIFPNHYAPWVYISLTAIVGIYVMFLIGKELGDKRLGIILAALTAVAPGFVISSTGLSNPDLVSITTIIAVWVFVKQLKTELSWRWLTFWGFILGVGINNHYQSIPLLVMPLITLVYCKNRLRLVISVILGLFISGIPMLLFNMITHWHTLRGVIFYLTEGSKALYIANSWKIYLFQFWPQFLEHLFGLPQLIMIGAFSLYVVYTLWLFSVKKLPQTLFLLNVVFLVLFIFLRYFSGQREVYYVLYLHPFLFIFLGFLLWQLYNVKYGVYIAPVVIILCTGLMMPKSFAQAKSTESFINYTKDISFLVQKYPGKSFAIYDCGRNDRGRSQGYAFLLDEQKKLSSKGVRIGVYDSQCYDINTNTVESQKVVTNTHIDSQLAERGMVLLGSNVPSELLEQGWTQINPATVYDRELKWWYEKKP